MKRSRSRMPRRLETLNVFAGESLEAYDTLIERAQKRIHEINDTYHGQTISFEYRDEVVTGKFITAIEGEFPGTYMIVLQIPSSRVCNGPCFVHMVDERFGAIVVTGKGGIVGITAKAWPQNRVLAVPFNADMICSA
jgi:hypothetical protein